MGTRNRTLLEVFLAASFGLTVIVIPVALDPNAKQYTAAFIPIIRNGIEGMKIYSLLLLIGVGAIFGYFGKAPVWLVGPATLAFFPIWSLIDMLMGGEHNLFPFEWLLYGLESVFGVIGAGTGRFIKKKVRPN